MSDVPLTIARIRQLRAALQAVTAQTRGRTQDARTDYALAVVGAMGVNPRWAAWVVSTWDGVDPRWILDQMVVAPPRTVVKTKRIALGTNMAAFMEMEVYERAKYLGTGPDVDPEDAEAWAIVKASGLAHGVLDVEQTHDAIDWWIEHVTHGINSLDYEIEGRNARTEEKALNRKILGGGQAVANRLYKMLKALGPRINGKRKRGGAGGSPNATIKVPKPPGPWVDEEQNYVTGERYEDFVTTDPPCTFGEGTFMVREANGGWGAGGGFRTRGAVLHAMRVCKLDQWYRHALVDEERWNRQERRPYTDAEMADRYPDWHEPQDYGEHVPLEDWEVGF